MDSSAIEKIREAETAKTLDVVLHNAIEAHQGAVALPDSYNLVGTEQYQQFKSRFRGSMQTGVIETFVDYTSKYSGDTTECFITPEKMSAKVVFDVGTVDEPGHCEFSGTLQLEKSAEYAALCEFANTAHSQRNTAEWLEDWSDFISAADESGGSVSNKKLVSAIRRITVESSRKDDHERL